MNLYFPMGEYEARWARVEQSMIDRGYDVAVVWSRSGGTFDRCGDVLYLSNYVSTESGQEPDNKTRKASAFSAVILVVGEKPMLVADEPPQEHLIATDNHVWSYDTVSKVAEIIKSHGNRNVAIVGSDILPMKYAGQMFEACPKLVVDDMLIHMLRMKKSTLELEVMRHGGATASRALSIVMDALKTGKSEAEAAAMGATEVMVSGGAVHFIPISHGETIEDFCRNPLTGYSQDIPQPGDLVRAWVYGPMWQGYWMDPGRTTVVGKPTDEQRHLVESCAGIVDSLIAIAKPGVMISELTELGDALTREAGGGQDKAAMKWPIYGHGLGLFWEKPDISKLYAEFDIAIEPNMAFGIEAFLGIAGVGSAGFEQNIIITDDGAELLTTTPMLMWDD
jgi:Xaa-Pro dipeptidase